MYWDLSTHYLYILYYIEKSNLWFKTCRRPFQQKHEKQNKHLVFTNQSNISDIFGYSFNYTSRVSSWKYYIWSFKNTALIWSKYNLTTLLRVWIRWSKSRGGVYTSFKQTAFWNYCGKKHFPTIPKKFIYIHFKWQHSGYCVHWRII